MTTETGERRPAPTGPTGEPSVGLRLGLLALTTIAAIGAIFAGAVAGFAWSFGACYKQTCSEVDAAAIVLLPIVGLAVAVGGGIAAYVKRRWFYAHPLAIWVPLAVLGGFGGLLVVSWVITGT